MFDLLSLFNIFNLFALLYVFRGAQIILKVRNEWQALYEEPLTRAKKHLAEEASFYIAVPPSVFIHELCHALAVWLFGGEVVRFTYRFFLGWVEHFGVYANWQSWFISLAGTLGNLLFAIVLYIALRNHRSSSFRFFGLRAVRFQIVFALLYYPIITIFMVATNTAGGDWATIYNFSATPIISGITAVFHIAGLILFFVADRHGRFEMPGFESVKEQNAFLTIAESAKTNPENEQTYRKYVAMLHMNGAPNKAKHALKHYMKTHPNFAGGWLLLAQLESEKVVSPAAHQYVQKAIQLGLSEVMDKAIAHMLVGRYLAKTDLVSAKRELDLAIQMAVPKENPEQQSPKDLLLNAKFYYWRSQVYSHQNDIAQANEDIQTAVHLAEIAKQETAVAFYKEKQKQINSQQRVAQRTI